MIGTTVPVERLREALDYDPETGVFTWKITNRKGRRAGSPNICTGYRRIVLDYVSLAEHRCAWAWMLGEWPDHILDHRDGLQSDNRWEQLRPATYGQNNSNTKRRIDNTSGFKGVHFLKRTRKWVAYISHEKRRYHLGSFAEVEDARAAYIEAAERMFGEYMRAA